MDGKKSARTLSNVMYGVGCVAVLVLLGFVVFGAGAAPNPEAMIPWTMREMAFVGLAVGVAPMLLSCMAVYKYNGIRHSSHKGRNLALVFLPGFLCGGCLLVAGGMFVAMLWQALGLAAAGPQ